MTQNNQHKANYRVAITCPACNSAVRIKRSERVSQRTRQYQLLQCTNVLCGWSGSGVFEITHTISPPNTRYQVALLPSNADDDLLDKLTK